MLGLLYFLTFCLVSIHGHGYLLEPPARSTAWRVDPSFKQCCTYYEDNQMYCGGFEYQWNSQGGRCSICGEPYGQANNLFGKGEAKYLGKIVKTYTQGQQINVTVVITANHNGFFQFRLCNLDDNPDSDATQICLDRGLLKVVDTNSTKFGNVSQYGSSSIFIRVQLPSDVVCQHCVFQWKYTTANSWGTDPVTGKSGPGMGIQNEMFMGCSDISIVGNNSATGATNNAIPHIDVPTDASASTSVSTASLPSGDPTIWSSDGVQYKVGDIVSHGGSTYICTDDYTSYPGSEPDDSTSNVWKLLDEMYFL